MADFIFSVCFLFPLLGLHFFICESLYHCPPLLPPPLCYGLRMEFFACMAMSWVKKIVAQCLIPWLFDDHREARANGFLCTDTGILGSYGVRGRMFLLRDEKLFANILREERRRTKVPTYLHRRYASSSVSDCIATLRIVIRHPDGRLDNPHCRFNHGIYTPPLDGAQLLVPVYCQLNKSKWTSGSRRFDPSPRDLGR